MARRTYLDTHVVIWLHDGEVEKLSDPARSAINEHPVHISEFVRLELQYLEEIGKLRVAPDAIVRYLQDQIGLQYCDIPLKYVITEAMGLSWTHDPFDRLITATASVGNDPLVTRNRRIAKHYGSTVF